MIAVQHEESHAGIDRPEPDEPPDTPETPKTPPDEPPPTPVEEPPPPEKKGPYIARGFGERRTVTVRGAGGQAALRG